MKTSLFTSSLASDGEVVDIYQLVGGIWSLHDGYIDLADGVSAIRAKSDDELF